MSSELGFQPDRRTVLGAIGATAFVAPVAGAARRPGPKEDEVLVGVEAGRDLVGTVRPAVPAGGEVVHENEVLRYVAVSLPDDADAAAFVEGVAERPGVRYAERSRTYRALFEPNDPLWDEQYAPRMIDADDAWDVRFDTSEVTVAVVDQGAWFDHEDLDGTCDGGGGRDFVDGDADPCPDDLATETHGTMMAGVALAGTDNATGIAGVSESTLLSVRALDEDGAGSISDVADAIQWATDAGADVINLSFGGVGFSQTLENAVAYAWENDVLLVGAAGNDGPCSDCVVYPAKFEEVVAVSALDPDGSLASYSSTGPEVELSAPGTNVLTTVPYQSASDPKYQRTSGTSVAAAVVSGAAAHPMAEWGIGGHETRRHLRATATDLGMSSNEQGCGRVDTEAAVRTDPANSGECTATCGARSETGTVSDSLSGPDDSDCWTWSWEFTTTCAVELTLTASSGLLEPDPDFDLYVNDGRAQCPTTGDFDSASASDGDESLLITDPDTSTALYVLVDSASGSGDYTLTITERST